MLRRECRALPGRGKARGEPWPTEWASPKACSSPSSTSSARPSPSPTRRRSGMSPSAPAPTCCGSRSAAPAAPPARRRAPTAASSSRPSPREDGTLNVDRYEIDFRICMYCGLCTEACPYQAIQSGGRYDDAVYVFEDMYRDRGRADPRIQGVPRAHRRDIPQRPAPARESRSARRCRPRAAASPSPAATAPSARNTCPASSTATSGRRGLHPVATINAQRRRDRGRGGPSPRRGESRSRAFASRTSATSTALSPYAGCRTCIVEIEGGRPGPAAALVHRRPRTTAWSSIPRSPR